MCHYIITSLKDKVGTAILNDPEKRNTPNKAMASELCQALESYRFNPDVWVATLRDADGYLSVGSGITSMKKHVDYYARDLRSEAQTRENMAGFNRLILAIRQIEEPAVGWIEGACADGNLSIVMAPNSSIADESCKMIFAFVNTGLAPDMGSSFMLMRHVGLARATDLFVTGRRFIDGEAARLGIITQAVPTGDPKRAVNALAVRLATGSAVSYREVKGVVNRVLYPDLYQCMAMESDYVDRPTHTTGYAGVIYAFLGKRTPRFSGA